MPTMDIYIQDDDNEPAWPDLRGLPMGSVVHLPDARWQVAILARGMSSGLPSVALRLEIPTAQGTVETVVAETSFALWSSVTIAGRARFPETFTGGPLDVDSSGG